MKFKTPDERKKLCQDYITHIEQGFSKESFPPCDMQTLGKYIDQFPEDFDTDGMVEAERKGRFFWEGAGKVERLAK